MKVLVIEDHLTDLKLLKVVLRLDGHTVRELTSATGVVEAILEDRPDIILLDLRLPGIDGPTLVRQLKADASTRQIPVVAVTAYPDQYRREEMLAAGCEAYIVKPIDTRELSNQLEEVAERKAN